MPVGGFVVNVHPDSIEQGIAGLKGIEGLEIHGSDQDGNVVIVLESDTSEKMDKMVKSITEIEQVLSVGLTYFNAEDEVERIKAGSYIPDRSIGKRPIQ